MSNSASIEPLIISQPILCNSVRINKININLGISAHIEILLCDTTGIRDIRILEMTGSDYANWGNNDDYVMSWILSQIGASPVSN